MLPKHLLWDYSRARLVTGLESMMIIGFPRESLKNALEHGFTDANLKELAGNAFTGQVVAAVLLSLIASIPLNWVQSLSESAASSVETEISEDDAEGEAELLEVIRNIAA